MPQRQGVVSACPQCKEAIVVHPYGHPLYGDTEPTCVMPCSCALTDAQFESIVFLAAATMPQECPQ